MELAIIEHVLSCYSIFRWHSCMLKGQFMLDFVFSRYSFLGYGQNETTF